MTVILKNNIKIGDKEVPKDSKGVVKGVTNSESIKQQYPHVTLGDWFYFIKFPGFEEWPVNKSDLIL